MAHNDDPPWLRPAPTLVLSKSIEESTSTDPQTSLANPSSTPLDSSSRMILALPASQTIRPIATGSSDSDSDSEDDHVGWRPQLTTVQQAAQAPPLSPLDLAMYPGAPIQTDPAAARKAVAGLRPLRILSSRRPGGPSSAGPSRPASTASTPGTGSATRSGFIGLLSAAKRASSIVTLSQTASSSSSPRANPQPLSISHAPIPVSPLPPPRTPPLVPPLSLAPGSDQMEPALRAYLESLASQSASNTSSAQNSPPRRGSQVSYSEPVGLTDEEKILLGIRDLDAERATPVRNLDAEVVNRKSQSKSHRSPSISEFTVIRDLDAQPRTPAPLPVIQEQKPLTPSPPSSPKLLSPILLAPNSLHSPVTPLTDAANLNRNLELSLYNLERALGRNPQSRSHSQSNSVSTISSGFDSRRNVYTPRTARTTSSHAFSVFSSRTTVTPLTTPPASPPPLPRPFVKQPVDLPCMVCSRPMQNTTSTRCGHVFCRGCVEGRSACPICRAHVEDSDLRAIHLFV